MTAQERHLHRDRVARVNGYRKVTPAPDPDWAGARLPEQIDNQAALAALELRGLPKGEAA